MSKLNFKEKKMTQKKSLIYASQGDKDTPIYINVLNSAEQGYLKFEISPVQAMTLASSLMVMVQPFVVNPSEKKVED